VDEFKDKIAVVTGSGGRYGIGRATARLLAEQGCKVALSDIDDTALKAAEEELSSAGHDVFAVHADVADYDSVRHLADAVYDHYGQVDILHLNAGVAGVGTLLDDDLTDWNRTFGINFFGILHGIKAFVPRMIAQGTPAHVLGTSSSAGAVGVSYQTPSYSVSKQAVCTLLECLYGQLRDLGSQIEVHVLLPPLTRTNLAGSPDVMPLVQQGLAKGGVPTSVAEPGEVAATVVEAIRSGTFWALNDHDADERLAAGRFAAAIDWEKDIFRKRAASFADRTAPDPYLWAAKFD
jgi:NAD(P)-dependent dehydrogenase (short-subunit alcohol dehydrogenase family)